MMGRAAVALAVTVPVISAIRLPESGELNGGEVRLLRPTKGLVRGGLVVQIPITLMSHDSLSTSDTVCPAWLVGWCGSSGK